MGALFGGQKQALGTTRPAIYSVRIQQSSYGVPIPLVWGTNRVAGNLLWYGDFFSQTSTSQDQSGGKGGGSIIQTIIDIVLPVVALNQAITGAVVGTVQNGASGAVNGFIQPFNAVGIGGKGGGNAAQGQTTTTYFASLLFGLCEGPITGLATIWSSKTKTTLAKLAMTLFTGSYSQTAWGYLTTHHAGQDLNYRGQTYVAVSSMQLDSNANLPNFSYEIKGLSQIGGGSNYSETDVVPGSPYQVTVAHAAAFTEDLGVVYWNSIGTGAPLTPRYASATLTVGQYSVVDGVYTFAAADQGKNITITYTTAIVDALPTTIITEFLTNANYGVGLSSAQLGDWTQYTNYCGAFSLFLSPALVQQQDAATILTTWLQLTISAPFWSEGLLKITPYGDLAGSGNGYTYTPTLTAQYALTDSDYLYSEGKDPVLCKRMRPADAYNWVRLEILDRANDYNPTTIEVKDQYSIDTYGLRPMPTITAHDVCVHATGQQMAQLLLHRQVGIRNTYTFTLPVRFCLLDPMDIVEITDSGLGLTQVGVRITKIEEDADLNLTITAEDLDVGVNSAPVFNTQTALGFLPNYNLPPPNVNLPILFEPPAALVNGLEVWLAVSGQGNYGGCEVWISFDNATYRRIAITAGSARMGVLSAALPAGSDPDTTHTLSVDLTESTGVLNAGTQADADAGRTICYVDGELISYETATLTATSKYDLGTYLRRGQYGTTNAAHAIGSPFVRLDQSIVRFGFDSSQIGKTVYFKFLAFNQFGTNVQSAADVAAYPFTLVGHALTTQAPTVSPPITSTPSSTLTVPNITGLTTVYQNTIESLYWNAVDDPYHTLDYEIRFGTAWASAQVLGRTAITTFAITMGDGTYWVAAHVATPTVDVYSTAPSDILLTGSQLTQNIVATWDEAATGWSGTTSGFAQVVGTPPTQVQLTGTGNVLTETNLLAETNLLWMGGVGSSGTYTIPASHRIVMAAATASSVLIVLTAEGVSIYNNMLTLSNVLAVTDFLGTNVGPVTAAQPQIRLSQDGTTWGAWQPYIPGTYVAKGFDCQVVLYSSDVQVTEVLLGLTFSVNVPTRTETHSNIALAAGGSAVAWTQAYNQAPHVQVTVLSATSGDTVLLTAITTTGCTVQVLNGGVGVARSVNVFASGY